MVRTFAQGTVGREENHVCWLPDATNSPSTTLKESVPEDRGLPRWNSPTPAQQRPLIPGQVEQGEEAESRKASREEKSGRSLGVWGGAHRGGSD